jgi:hypothetical protein
LLFSVHLLHIVLYWTRSLEAAPHLFGAPWFFPYLYGPLLFLYVRSLGTPGRPLRPRDGAHGIAFLVVTAASARFYLSSSEVKRRILEASYEQTAPAGRFVLAVFRLQYLHFLVYFAATLRETAEPEPRNRWAQRLLLGFAAAFTSWFAYGLAVSHSSLLATIDYGATLA